jgi:phosphatidylglycerophosphate synthase
VHRVQTGPVAGFVCVPGLLGVLAVTTDLSAVGWAVGVVSGAGVNMALARGLVRHHLTRLGPANRVTSIRATLTAAVAALTAESFVRHPRAGLIVSLAVVALVLDGVDGRVARRTRTASALGARFDMEIDAFLILVLSVYAARTVGIWVLGIGAARYLFVAAGWGLPWLRGTLPPRYWCKVVAATQGVVLTLAAAGVLPRTLMDTVLAASMTLLAETFGRQIWGLWHLRHRAGHTSIRLYPEPAGVGDG